MAKAEKALHQDAPPKFNRVKPLTNALFGVVFVILGLSTLLPLLFVIIISLSSEASVAANGYSFIPSEWSLGAYDYLWQSRAYIGRSFLNSIGITVIGTILGLTLIFTKGYALSRSHYFFKKLDTWMIFIPMLFGGGLVATYMVNTQIYHLKNTYWALLLPGACSGWYIIIVRTFFQTTIPESIIESGRIDGANQLRIFINLVLPISLPVIATIGLFLTFAYWNAWYGAMLYITSNRRDLYPLQYVLISIEKNLDFLTTHEGDISGMQIVDLPSETVRMAIVTVVVLPIACSYPFFQRYFVGGLTIGSVKG